MITSQAIEEIVVNVLKRMDQEGTQTKPRLFVIDQYPEDNSTQMDLLKNHWHIMKMGRSRENIPANVQHAVFLGVDQSLLVKSAIGIADTPESCLFSKLILRTAEIHFVLSDSLEEILNNNGNKAYVNQLWRYKSQLQQFGVNVTSIMDVVPISERHVQVDFTEKVLRKDHVEAWESDCVTIPSSTIITPLAYDAAKEKGISIHKRSDQKEL